MKLLLTAGTTSQLLRVFVQDASKADGSGLTGLAFNTTGLKWSYVRDDQSAVTAVTPVTAAVGAWTSAGFKEVDAANFPGLYEIGAPNAALASGKSAQIILWGAANMAVTLVEVELTVVNHQDGAGFGLSRLDVAVTTRSTYAGGPVASVTGAVGSVTAPVTVGANNDKTGYALVQAFPANFAALGISAGGKVTGVALVDALTTYTGNTPQTGDAFARLGAPAGASVSADIQTRSTYDPATHVPAVRNQDAVTAPTADDCLVAAWVEAYGKEPTFNATTWVKQKPDNSGAVRTFVLTTDTSGNVTARA